MKPVLCFFAIALTLLVYPIVLNINSDLSSFWGFLELDIFNWYRMLLIGVVGAGSFLCVRRKDPAVVLYLILLSISFTLSRFHETALYGTPMHHEGLIALLGYVGIYGFCVKYGFFKGLEKCLDIVVFIVFGVCLLQVLYGNFLDFFIFKIVMPPFQYKSLEWPLYGIEGCSNHLGLFCALFLPYAILRNKYIQVCLLIFMLIGSQCRGAWLSAIITTTFISRKALFYLIIAGILLSVPIHKKVAERIKTTVNDIHFPIRDKDLAGRAYMWKKSIPMLKESILIGKGPATFPLYFPQFAKRGDDIGFLSLIVDRPHNMFINIWQNTGLISLLVLSWVVLNAMLFSSDYSLIMGAMGFLIAGLFTDSVLCVTPYFLMFLGGMTNEYNEEGRHRKRDESGYLHGVDGNT